MEEQLCLGSFMLAVTYSECHIKAHYAECHYDECRYAKCRGTKEIPQRDNVSYLIKQSLILFDLNINQHD
jgi:hypothetical protein